MTLPHPVRLASLFTALLLLSTPAAPLRAQSVGGSVGPAVPVGALAEDRGVGLRIAGSLYPRGRLLRVDLAGVIFPGTGDEDRLGPSRGEYRSASLAANLVPTFRRTEALQVRGLFGLSVHRLSVPGVPNPYGTVLGTQVGGLLERTGGGRTLTAEAGIHLIGSDHGLGELEAALFIPLSIGIRW
ncbi:MAG TPA: hypothetical protein VLK84_04680 [Longimicrobium sp.]|nr:hypothetical protein [Longimicrobium sp.]